MSDQADPKPAFKDLQGRVGKYEIVRPLGKGAMGQVYVAHDTVLDRDVALKVMVAQIADDPELKARFMREARAVAKMTHPNVVTVFDLDSHTDGSPYIAMELLKGQDLQKAMRAQPPMTLERKVSVIVQVLAGLAHAHQAGIVHRDIKPANIFIQTDGSVKIMDFGVARLTTASMTGTGNIVGTADYMSPEQVKGSKVDGRSDLFSVGCMLFELLAGRRPFHSDNLMAIFYKITHEDPAFDSVASTPEYAALMPILTRALAKDLEARYPTAYAFALDLREWLKSNATGATGQHALESILDMEAVTSPPQPLTNGSGATVVPADTREMGGTVKLGTGSHVSATAHGAAPTVLTGTRSGARTVVGEPGAVRPGAARYGATAPTALRPPRRAPRPVEAGANPMLYVALGGLVVALGAAGGYIYWSSSRPDPTPPTTLAVGTPSTPPPTILETPPPPPTTAPPPTFAEARGKGAAAMRTAQSAFSAGNYDRAIASAQEALREDPGNREAQRLVENALNGQRAHARLNAAETALRQGNFPAAESEAEAARQLASWDKRVADTFGRIRDAQLQAQREAQRRAQEEQAAKQQQVGAQVAAHLRDAGAALTARQYDAAIKLYDEALKLDPANTAALQGRTGAVTAKAVAEAAAGAGGGTAGRSFAAGRTQAQSVETRAGAMPEGFEDSAGVTVKRGTQAAEMPGKIQFEVRPEAVKAGDTYSVSIHLLNEGAAPIQVQSMLVRTTINGRSMPGPVPPLVAAVAPRDKALLYQVRGEVWKEDTTSWSMEVTVRTATGETYRNTLNWK